MILLLRIAVYEPRTHCGVAGVSGQPLPLCRSNGAVFSDCSERIVGHSKNPRAAEGSVLVSRLHVTWPVWLRRPNVTVRLKDPNHGPNADANLARDPLDREPCFTKPYHFVAIENPARAPNCVARLCAVCPGGAHAGADALADQFSLELSHGSEDVHKELAGRIGFVRVEALRSGNEVKKTSEWTLPRTRREIQYILFTWTGVCAYCGATARGARSP